jgi:hypothetical protein
LAIEESREERVPWILIIFLAIVYGLVNPILTTMQPRSAAYWYNIGLTSCYLYTMPMSYIIILVPIILMRAHVIKGIRPSTLTYLYACIVSLAYPGVADPVFVPTSYWVDRYVSTNSVQLTPWFFAPTPEIAEQIVAGGVPIPWAEWLPSLLWWWILYMLWVLFFIGLATILRRQWIEVEKVPFPLTFVAYELVKNAGDEKADKGSKTIRSLLVGTLMGVIFFAILFMILMFPWFPDVFGWRVNTCGFGGTYITSDSPLAGIIALAMIEKNPIFVAGLYLIPLSILFNAWFWFIVVAVLVQIAFTMGFYTSLPTVGGCGRIFCGELSITSNPPFIWGAFANLGVALGIFASYWSLTRGYMVGTIRAALGKGSIAEIEKGEALSYRSAYILLLGSFALIVAAFMSASLSIISALVVVFVTLFYQFIQVRIITLTGFLIPSGFFTAAAFLRPMWPTPPDPRTMEWTVTTEFLVMPAANSPYAGWGHAFLAMSSSYQMASYTKTDPKKVLKVTMFSSILTPLLFMVSILWASYTFGLNRLPGQAFTWGPTDRFTPEWTENWPSRSTWWPHALIGFIVAFALNYLHARFIWFPFEPIGFLFALDWGSQLSGVWMSAFIAWALKVITLRIGGSALYESTGRPVAAGFIIGFAIVSVIGGTIGVVRFFFPF